MSALAAAAMSTLDSTYNSIATVATFDIYKRFMNPNRAAHHYEGVARKLSLLTAAVVVIPAMFGLSQT